MKTRGHWFCERCQEVIHLRADETEPARCPGCNRDSAVFIPDTPAPMHSNLPASKETARSAFAVMRQALTERPQAT